MYKKETFFTYSSTPSFVNLTFDIITSSLLSVSLSNFESTNCYFHDFRVDVIWEMSDEYSHHVSLEYQWRKSFVLKCFYFIYLFIYIFFGGGGGGSFDDAGISLQI